MRKKIFEDDTAEYFEEIINGFTVKLRHDKITGEVWIDPQDLFIACGGKGKFEDFLGTDQGLDLINEWHQDHIDAPGFLRLFRSVKLPEIRSGEGLDRTGSSHRTRQ